MSNKYRDCVRSENGYMESCYVREDVSRSKKKKRLWFYWIDSKEVCNCWNEWGEYVSELKDMGKVCMCGDMKKLCVSDECDCNVLKWSECRYVEVLDEYEVYSGSYVNDREDLVGLRDVRM